MILALLFAAQPAAPPADDPRLWEDPPTGMVDFLGRRRLCAELGEPKHRDAGERQEAERLQCAALQGEERRWRTRYAADPEVLRWIDRDPLGFHLNGIMVSSWDGPPGAHPQYVEQQGRDRRGRPFRLVIDRAADGGRLTQVTLRYADWPERIFALNNSRFPLIDLSSIDLAAGEPPREGAFHIFLHFGYPRGYCQAPDRDDRPLIQITFRWDGTSANFADRTNCQFNYVALTDAAAR